MSLNKTPSYLEEESSVIRHRVTLCSTVFGDEVEARWADPVHHPGHCSSPGLRIHEAHPAKNARMELERHGRYTLPVHGRKREILVVMGNQLSLAPSVTPWQDTLPAVHLSFR